MSARDATLAKAREAVAAMVEQDTGGQRPRWRLIITDSESPTGVALVCTAERSDALHMIHDYPGGPIRDEEGVYDCCPWPQIETFSSIFAAYLVELLNADAAAQGEKDTPMGEFTPQPCATCEHGPTAHQRLGSTGGEGCLSCLNDEAAWLHAYTLPKAAPQLDDMSNADVFTESELYEMDRDDEFRQDAEDDACNAAEYEAEERGDA
ncbi:hypothetical protein J7I98_04240 [Streptomyces sp. ISL-98]|uniref:hypothetical protein n=1 Tax=Streptomyces sp. ISL-98 TaxID=2819192 RepID=UPI001BE7E972|nr:hypothetical protein [Streptomyces sp. ISL-98]MBT2505117.1 hypothetical protein [Streptomyces sp. ISL-98]